MGKPFAIRLFLFAVCFGTLQFCCCLNSKEGCFESERQALLKFKSSLTGSLDRLSSWRGKDCCKWESIGCNNSTGHVIKLNLRNKVYPDSSGNIIQVPNQLKANAVDTSLLELQYMKHLDFSWNDFRGSPIPTFFASLSRLRYLNLSNANFNGMVPLQLGELSRLRVLDLSGSPGRYDFELSISDVHWFSRLSSLKSLDLSWINLSQVTDLHQVLNKLPFLVHLRLSSCGLVGFDFHGYVSSTLLEFFDVSANMLQGTIPEVIQNMTALKFLDLSANLFSSSIPPWLFDLKNLVHINFGVNNITGTIPNAIGKLSSLEFLDLSSNSLEGSVPESLWHLCSLKVIDLRMNRLTVISESSNIVDGLGCTKISLERLILRWNQIRAPLPDWFGNLKQLKVLDLGNNSFYGSMPSSFGRLSNLRVLDLTGNQLNGTIPESLGELSWLQKILLSTNSFQGTLTEVHFSNLSKLVEFDIGGNHLALKVNSDWIPPFQLRYINMKSCNVGPKFPTWLRTQTRVVTLYFSNTSISDIMPTWLPNLNFSHLYLSFNHIRGRLPTFNKPDSVYMNLYLSSNSFEGPLPTFPSTLNRLDLTNNLISGSLPDNIGDMTPYLDNLLLSGNQISGRVPESLCKINTLRVLDLSKNQLSGDIPDCWSEFKILAVLDFSANKFSGFMPSSLGCATSLKSLHLSDNNFRGKIPSAWKSCTDMVILDVGGNKLHENLPAWIAKSMLNLEVLRLRENMFSGTIPREMCDLTELQVLDLAQNNLSGSIPGCFDKLKRMIADSANTSEIGIYRWSTTYGENLFQFMKGKELEYTKTLKYLVNMDISGNKITGTIPENLTVLAGLRGLNLSDNLLRGQIPDKIGKMSSLESLDLSRNQLSGSIPPSLSALTSLSHLNLSYNKLSGQIPSGNQLQTLNDPSIYVNNSGLCGDPLSKCASPKLPRKGDEEGGEGEGVEIEWFFVSMSAGYVTSLMAVIGVLVYKRNWREAYFRFLDEVSNWIIEASTGRRRRRRATTRSRSRWSYPSD